MQVIPSGSYQIRNLTISLYRDSFLDDNKNSHGDIIVTFKIMSP